MEEEKGLRDPLETGGAWDPPSVEGRRGPSWRAWVLSILVAVALSVTSTLLLGGSGSFRSDRAGEPGAVGGGCGSGAGSGCCPPADTGK